MIEKLKQLMRDSLIYGLGKYINTFIGIIFVPMYTRIFPPSEYGVVDLIGSTISIIVMFLILGLDSATALYFYDTEDIRDRKIIVSTSFYFRMALSIVICSMLFFSSEFISELIFNSKEYAIYLKIGVASIPFSLAIGFFLDLMRLKFESLKFSVISIGNTIVTSILIIYLIIFLKLGIVGIFIGMLISNIIFFFIGIYLTYKEYILSFSLPRLRNLLSFGLPLFPSSIAIWLLTFSDRYFLVKYSTLNEVGLYSIGVKLSHILLLVTSAFQLSWGPFAFSIQKESDAKNIYSKVLTYYLIIALFLATGLSFFSKEILMIATQVEYVEAYKVVGILSYVVIFGGIYYIVSIGVNLTKKTHYISFTTGVAALINIILNFLMIPYLGMVGAAIASLIANSCSVFFLYRISQKYYHIDYEINKIIKIILLSGFLILTSIFLDINSVILNYLLKLSLLLSFVVFLILYVFEKNEVDFINKMANNILLKIRKWLLNVWNSRHL